MELTASTALSRGPSGSSRRSASPPGSSKLVTVGHALSAVSTGPCCDEAMLCGSPNALCCEDDACLEGAAQATAGESCGTEGACTCEKDGKGKQKADGVETCVECRQAMVGGCTEDCFNPPREDDCAECEKVDTSGCSVPGCQEVEWDEQAVDELVRLLLASESAGIELSIVTRRSLALAQVLLQLRIAPPLVRNSLSESSTGRLSNYRADRIDLARRPV